MNKGLDGFDHVARHHLERGRHEARSDDGADARGGVIHRYEVDEQGADGGRIGRQPDRDTRRDAERALAAHERAAQVVAGRLRVEAAERHHGRVRQHHLDRKDVGRCDAVLEAVRTTRVVGDVAADRARLLTGRIRCEVQPVHRKCAREIEVDDTRLDPRDAFVGVDRNDPVHLRRDHDDGTAQRHCAAGEPGARASSGERAAVLQREPDARLHLCGRDREAHDGRLAALDDRRVVGVQVELERFGSDALGRERGAKIVDECSHRVVDRTGADSHEPILPATNVHPVKTKVPADLHEWLSFDDPDEERTWVFDVTFLTSAWMCIFGNGCPGVLTGPAPELVQGCCSYGAHFTDKADQRRTERLAKKLTADEWQFKKKAEQRGGPVKVNADGEVVTRLVDGACIFLNRPGFPTGPGCALHQAALQRGQRPLDWKPEVCWQLPLRRIDETDVYGHVTSTVREWKRRDWGEGGEEFHWWCTDAAEPFVAKEPVYETMRDELIELVGAKPYAMFAELVRRRNGTSLPHPALKVRRPRSK